MDIRRSARGLSLVEVMAAMAILVITLLGVVNALVVAINTNGDAARRSQMKEFARSRLERLVTSNRQNAPPVPAGFAVGTFTPDVPPGTGGWVLDTLESQPGLGGGDDANAGPVMVDGEGSGLDLPATRTLRSQVLAASPPQGCGDPALAQRPDVFCREVHVEPASVLAAPGAPSVPMLRVWVRAVRGGGDWRYQSVTLQKDLAR